MVCSRIVPKQKKVWFGHVRTDVAGYLHVFRKSLERRCLSRQSEKMTSIFDPSVICDNQEGWGPTAAASVITTGPFMPFSKGERQLGRIAEFGSSVHKYGRQQYNRGMHWWSLVDDRAAD